MRAQELINKLKEYSELQLNRLGKTDPLLSLIKPIASRAINTNIDKLKSFTNLIADSEGNIDVEGIVEEMFASLMETNPFVLNTSFVGDIEIGGGCIKLNIPLTSKRLVLNQSDIQELRNLLIAR